jgi:hypothetical protein
MSRAGPKSRKSSSFRALALKIRQARRFAGLAEMLY